MGVRSFLATVTAANGLQFNDDQQAPDTDTEPLSIAKRAWSIVSGKTWAGSLGFSKEDAATITITALTAEGERAFEFPISKL
jgi:hypothetical protein